MKGIFMVTFLLAVTPELGRMADSAGACSGNPIANAVQGRFSVEETSSPLATGMRSFAALRLTSEVR
jgi:hypothetical protein